MNRTEQTAQNLTRAEQAAEFPVSALQQALKTANAVQGLAILALIERAVYLRRDIDALRAAVWLDFDDEEQAAADEDEDAAIAEAADKAARRTAGR